MKFTLENCGPIKKADIELGDLTIICGKNSTGKTYITYSFISFLEFLSAYDPSLFREDDEKINEKIQIIKKKGIVEIDAYDGSLINSYNNYYFKIFSKKLPQYLSLSSNDTKSSNDTNLKSFVIPQKTDYPIHELKWRITSTCLLEVNCLDLHRITFTLKNEGNDYPDDNIIRERIIKLLNYIIKIKFLYFPVYRCFTCERTSISLFVYKILTSTLNKSFSPDELSIPGYQWPVVKEMFETVNIKDFNSIDSFIAKEHPEILGLLEDMVKGKYIYDDKTNQMMFIPEGTTDVILTMNQSSSTVRSLCTFDFFLRHQIQPHQTIVMDEPELNLHPENQRKLARLFAMLINIGIKVMITTHSDYIIKEFNTLLMLNYKEDPRTTKLQKKYGYSSKELLDAEKVKLYIVENGTANAVPVTQDAGMTIDSFDESIREMGIIQRDILYGGEEQ